MSVDVEALKARTDIVALISSYVPDLKKRGVDWWACCPLHGEKTASFKVSPEGWFKCHGCGVGGDCFSFLENIEHTDFKGALAKLQEFLGETPGTNGHNGNGNGHKPQPVTPEWLPKETVVPPNLPVPHDAPDCSFVHSGLPKPDEVWPYRNQKGELLGYDARYNKPGSTDKLKVLPWRFMDGMWQMKGFSAPTPLYGLETLSADLSKPVLMVEGCKCVHAGRKLFGNDQGSVLSWQGGAEGVRKVDLTPLFGRVILLWPDADSEAKKTPGQKAMLYIGNKLMHVCPKVLYFDPNPKTACVSCVEGVDVMGEECAKCQGTGRVYAFPLMPDGWDAADAVADGWTASRWREWANPRMKPIDLHAVDIMVTAEFERILIKERSAAGRVVARSNGVVFGRKPKWQDISLPEIEAAVEAAGSLRKAAPVIGIPLTTLRARWREIIRSRDSRAITETDKQKEEVTV